MFIHTHAYCLFLSRVVHIFIKLYQSTDFHVPDFAFCNQTNWNNTFQPWENTGKSHYMLALILCSSENYYYWPIIKQCIEPDEPLVWSSMAKSATFLKDLWPWFLQSALQTQAPKKVRMSLHIHIVPDRNHFVPWFFWAATVKDILGRTVLVISGSTFTRLTL